MILNLPSKAHTLVLFCLIILPNRLFANSSPIVRVAVAKNVSEIELRAEELYVRIPEPKPIRYFVGEKILVTSEPDGIRIGNSLFSETKLWVESNNERIQLNDKTFEGRILVEKMANDQLLMLNEVPLEKYLVGLIHGEISADWPLEAIKAQAVASRTYALYRQKKGDPNSSYLEADHMDQVYIGSLGEKDERVQEAIQETVGQVLWYLGLYPAYFHSSCGGQTETTNKAWDRSEPSQSIVDPYCQNSPHQQWTLKMKSGDLLSKLKSHGLEGNVFKSIQLEQYENSPRNALVIIETDKMTLFLKATDLRKVLGYKELKSTWFTVGQNGRNIIFNGTGFGHGVGLCQWGSKTMAEEGKNYQTILKFYYPKAELKKIY